MQSQLRALFSALPAVGKILWFIMGGVQLLAGALHLIYFIYWALTPEQMHWAAFTPDIASAFGSLFYGLFITVIAGLFGASQLRKQRKKEQLIQFGQRIDPPITKIEESLLRGGHGERYYYIYSHWQDPATGKKHTFESERLNFDPSAQLRRGDTIPIYFEHGNPTNYYLDISSLTTPKRFFWQ